jgi:nitroreductase
MALQIMTVKDLEEGFKAVLDYKHVEDPLRCNAEEFEKVVETRRSVRVFDSTPVPEAVIRRCLDLAMLAPNSSNLQPWEWYWVRNPEKKAKLVRWCMSQPAARTAQELIVVVARPDSWWRARNEMLKRLEAKGDVPAKALEYYRMVVPMAYLQLGNLFAVMKHFMFNMLGIFRPLPREPNFNSGMAVWAIKSVCLAASTFMLGLRAHGFDSCPMEGIDQKRIRKLLGLPRRAEIPMVIGVGKRAPNGVYGPRIRFDNSWFVKEV